ncbi:alpha/beta-hydrolase family protein [Gordonia sp. NPDC003376]
MRQVTPGSSEHRTAAPHPAVTVAATAAALTAVAPSGLPRGVVTEAVVVAALVALGTAIAVFAVRHRPRSGRSGRLAASLALPLVTAAVVGNALWQNLVRADLGTGGVGAEYPAAVLAAAVGAFGVIVWMPRPALAAGMIAGAVVAGSLAVPGQSAAATVHRAPIPDDGNLSAAATQLVDAWVRDGGLDRSAVVIAVPTGSGWVDATAVAGIDARFGGDVEILTLPYASTTSWRAFVTDPGAAARSAIALFDAVADAVGQRPGADRPQIHLYGQSLGALGADRTREWAERHRAGMMAGTLLAGVPADTVARVSATPRTVLANPSDPVTRWSVASLWRPPSRPDDTRTVGRAAHTPPWLPVVSFVQTSVDLLTSLDGAAGTGHRYGTEQGDLPRVGGRDEAGQPIGPRAAS